MSMPLKNVVALVLAGGKGTRLEPDCLPFKAIGALWRTIPHRRLRTLKPC